MIYLHGKGIKDSLTSGDITTGTLASLYDRKSYHNTPDMVWNRIPQKYRMYLSVGIIVIMLGIPLNWYMTDEASSADITVLQIDGAPQNIVFITDPHIRKENYNETMQVIEDINALNPSVILLGGDFIFGDGNDLHLQEVWSSLQVPAYAVLGNHDYHAGITQSTLLSKIIRGMTVNVSPDNYDVSNLYDDTTDFAFADNLTHILETNNVTVLKNECISLQVNGTDLTVVGIDDGMAGLANPPMVTDNGAFTIYLIHEPDLRSEWGADLVLSGHTHGGQFFPKNSSLLGLVLSGLVSDTNQWTYVSRGIGTSNLNHEIRLFSTPEIVVINPSVRPEEIFPDKKVQYFKVPGKEI